MKIRTYDVRLLPRIDETPIKYLIIHVEGIPTHQECIKYLEVQFPFYSIESMLGGYRQHVEVQGINTETNEGT
jgi:hypothetical protein